MGAKQTKLQTNVRTMRQIYMKRQRNVMTATKRKSMRQGKKQWAAKQIEWHWLSIVLTKMQTIRTMRQSYQRATKSKSRRHGKKLWAAKQIEWHWLSIVLTKTQSIRTMRQRHAAMSQSKRQGYKTVCNRVACDKSIVFWQRCSPSQPWGRGMRWQHWRARAGGRVTKQCAAIQIE